MDLLLAMRLYVRVVERESLSRAASDLGMSQSTISDRMLRLEEHLGGKLLYRNTRALSLTDIGEEFYIRSKRTLDLAAIADDTRNSSDANTLRGTLRIVAPFAIGDFLLPCVLDRFRRLHPDLNFELILNDRIMPPHLDGADIALRLGDEPANGCTDISLGVMTHVLVASDDYLATNGSPRTPSELKQHPFVRVADTFEDGTVTLMSEDEVLNVAINPMWTVGNWRPLRTLLLGGAGIGIAAMPAVRDCLASGALRRLLPQFQAPSKRVRLLHANSGPAPDLTKRAVAHLTQQLGDFWCNAPAGA